MANERTSEVSANDLANTKRAMINLLEDLTIEKENIEHIVAMRTAELNRAKVHTEIIIENLTDGLIEYSADYRIRRVNSSAERLLGFKREAILGSVLSSTSKVDAHLQSLVSVLFPAMDETRMVDTTNAMPQAREIKIVFPIATDLKIFTIALPTGQDFDGGFIILIRDVTEEKLIEQSKRDFISIVAHQLRTPLSTVKWSLSVLLEGDYGELDPRFQKKIALGYNTNERMIKLVNDLLDAARIEEGRYGYLFAKGSLCDLVANIAEEYAVLMQKKSLEFRVSNDPTLPLISFDASKLSLAIHNLVDNALLYTQEGGTISIDITHDEEWAYVQVVDTGIGISAKNISKLFSKFFRGENAILEVPNGSGLGLFIANNIVLRHGGTIEVHSDKRGSSFSIRLPLVP
ncbi:MAG: ATP-binding protein [Patescibacteria group bacterium]